MKTFLASGLFDSPWAVLIIFLVGSIINWLSQRRKQQSPAEHDAPGPQDKEPDAFDPEAALRRLLGQELEPPPLPPPPVISRHSELERPATPIPAVLPPLSRSWSAEITSIAAAQGIEAAARPPALPGLPTPRVHAILERRASRPTRAQAGTRWKWHDRASARQAFVASLVFGPPKGLES